MTKEISKLKGKKQKTERQHAALPYRLDKDGNKQILLITSRERKRWIIPKGWPIKKKNGRQTAAIEAYEEAGVKGSVGKKAIGYFDYLKIRSNGISVPCIVTVYPMEVEKLKKEWPEMDERQRRWFSVEEAVSMIDDATLKTLVAKWAR